MGRTKNLRVRNWDKYQHYDPGSRRMIWFKIYGHDRLADPDLMRLRADVRELSTCLLCLAMQTDNCIPNDPKWIGNRTQMNSGKIEYGLRDLLKIGFLEPYSEEKLASKMRQKDRPRAEAEQRGLGKGSSLEGPSAKPPAKPPAKKKKTDKPTDERSFQRLLASIKDKDDRTEDVLRAKVEGWPQGALEGARERIRENGVRSQAKLAVHLFTKDTEFAAAYGMAA